MENKFLEKFEYDPETFDKIKDKIVTWDGRKVEILREIQTSSTNKRLLGIIHEPEGTENITMYTFSGQAQGVITHNADLYIDRSVTKYINVGIMDSELGTYTISGPYDTREDAVKMLRDHEYETLEIRLPVPKE